jgi:hypothetical protein
VVGNQGCTPGFWKNHTGLGRQANAWCGTYSPNELVSNVFPSLASTECGCDFTGLTFIQALQGGGGSTICDAQRILLRAAVAALLNACSGSGVSYPLTTDQIKTEVNAALTSCDRNTTLNEAGRLDGFNNGPGGCPLPAVGLGPPPSGGGNARLVPNR